MVGIYSPSSSHSSSSDGRHHPGQHFGGPGFHGPPPHSQSAAPHGHLNHHNHSPPPSPPPYRHGHHQSHQFCRPAFGESMVSFLPAHDSAAPHPFMSRNHSPPPLPPPPSHGHGHSYPQQFGSPPRPPSPPPPSLGHHHRHHQQFGRPSFQEPTLSTPPADHERGAPFHGHDHGHLQQFSFAPAPPIPFGHHHPPPPSGHDHGHSHPLQFGRPALLELPILSPPPAHERGAPHSFTSLSHSPPPPPPPPPPSHGGHHPPPPSHIHSHGHHPASQQSGRPAIHEVMLSPHSAPSMSLSRRHSPPPPPPPHLDHRNHSLSLPSSPHHHVGALHYSHEFGRPPGREIEAPHLFMDHLHRSHSPPPPPPPHGHSSAFHGFLHHTAKFCEQPPMEPTEEVPHRYEPFISGTGLHPSHQFSGHGEGLRRHTYMPNEMGGAHHGRHSPPHPRSPPPKHRGKLVAPSSYPPFCIPLVPAAYLSNGHRPQLAVPVC